MKKLNLPYSVGLAVVLLAGCATEQSQFNGDPLGSGGWNAAAAPSSAAAPAPVPASHPAPVRIQAEQPVFAQVPPPSLTKAATPATVTKAVFIPKTLSPGLLQ